MAIQLECPGCKNLLQVDDSLAGKAGKCIHCGQRIVVPGGSGKPVVEPVETSLFEATPEAMVRELGSRGHSAVLFLFHPPSDGSYDISNLSDNDLSVSARKTSIGAIRPVDRQRGEEVRRPATRGALGIERHRGHRRGRDIARADAL